MPPKASKAAPKPAAKLQVPLVGFVLVRMPAEDGKPADRYAVVKVKAVADVAKGEMLGEGMQLVYARKQCSIEISRMTEQLQRSVEVVA